MLRGGSWNNNPQNVRCANRNNNEPTNRNNNVGFRCAQDAGNQDAGVQLFTDNWSVHATVQSSFRSRRAAR
ncbi:SUMF1/EgtB/PvdO family nonheme iron enzyme [candidate division KSB1 bacterium]|nr:SUMF1/EgtB/PvdO family nonheme iron enzyme [candidate division KSB1 bacterium]